MPVVTGIYRYPIKGLSPQPLAKAALAAGEPFPFDRVFALVRPGAPVDTHNPRWAKKGLFLMLMLDEALARVRTHLDADTLELTIAQGNQQLLAARLADPDHYAAVEDFFYRLVPSLRAPPKLVRSRAGHFMDKPDNVLSLINLATVRALEEQWGYEIDPLRFRANFYIDGARAWEEFGWIGRDIRIGDTLFSVDRRNGRCGATNVNPGNGRRDLDLPASLRAAFGHKDLGVYVVAKESGAVAVGDALAVPHSLDEAPILHQALSIREVAERAFICRGCYFIYREKTGLPSDNIAPGTAFADLPAQWRCPDCGTDKATFRPYVHRVA